jgi:hypothetical protein
VFEIPVPKGRKYMTVVSSPLCYDGLVYSISESGGLVAVDARTKKEHYWARPELCASYTWTAYPGVSASPTLAGENIYLFGDAGAAVVMKPGREYQPLARNALVDNMTGQGGLDYLSTPFFDGSNMYYRSGNYLYCIGEK